MHGTVIYRFIQHQLLSNSFNIISGIMIRTLPPIRILAFMALAGLSMLAAISLRAQESFNATHVTLFFPSSSVAEADRRGGVGIFRAEREAGIMRFRITIADPGTPITGVDVRFHQPGGGVIIVDTLQWPPGMITAEGSITTESAVFDLFDIGSIYFVVKTAAYPNGFAEGRVEALSNFITFEFRPSQETEVPDSAYGRGNAYLIFDEAARSVRYLVRWERLTGAPQQAHFHRGAPKVDGPPVHTITLPANDSMAHGTWTDMSNEDIAALKRGDIYVNVHTAKYPKGEIRGQIVPVDFFTAAIRPEHAMPAPNASNASGTGYLVYATLPGLGDFLKSFVAVGTTAGTIDSVHLHNGAAGMNGPMIATYDEVYVELRELEMAMPQGLGLGDADVAALRAGNIYVDVHTADHAAGEARGQWIPAATNSGSGSSGVTDAPSSTEALRLASYGDGIGGIVRFAITGGEVRGERRIRLYSSLGAQVAEIDAENDIVEMSAGMLASGIYIARLVVDGEVLGTCRVAVAR